MEINLRELVKFFYHSDDVWESLALRADPSNPISTEQCSLLTDRIRTDRNIWETLDPATKSLSGSIGLTELLLYDDNRDFELSSDEINSAPRQFLSYCPQSQLQPASQTFWSNVEDLSNRLNPQKAIQIPHNLLQAGLILSCTAALEGLIFTSLLLSKNISTNYGLLGIAGSCILSLSGFAFQNYRE